LVEFAGEFFQKRATCLKSDI